MYILINTEKNNEIKSMLNNSYLRPLLAGALGDGLLGIRETSLSGRNTRNDLNMRKSTSTFASAKIVIDLYLCTFKFFGTATNRFYLKIQLSS